MSSEEVGADLIWLAKRGARVALVRNGRSGDAFATLINEKARDLKVPGVDYDKFKLSRLENGKQTFLPAEEAAIIALLDEEKRGVEWLALGQPGQPGVTEMPETDEGLVLPARASESAAGQTDTQHQDGRAGKHRHG